jgi:hypothetical protein
LGQNPPRKRTGQDFAPIFVPDILALPRKLMQGGEVQKQKDKPHKAVEAL